MKLNLLKKGKELSIERGQTILVSMVKKINIIDPLEFFEAGKEVFNGQRSFWSDLDRELVLVGLGAEYTIRTEVTDRYKEVEEIWKKVLGSALYDRQTNIPGTGPVLIGGFSFDPLKIKTKLWSEYDHTRLVLPKFLLTIRNDEAYLTTNVFISKETNVEQTSQTLSDLERMLLSELEKTMVPPLKRGYYEKEEVEPEQWKQTVSKLAKEIRENVLDKVVLARELRIHSKESFSPYITLFHLREEQPRSYLFAIENGTNCFLGASPERLVKQTGVEVLSTCLAGSIGRGDTPESDVRLGEMLLQDKKNLYEHQVVVNMIKSEMEKGCDNLNVPNNPVLMKLKNIQHLYTPVKGEAKKGVSILGLINLLHPTPALGGFPKETALKKIRKEELLDRGWYASPVGWIDSDGNGEFAVAIRSGLIQGKEASLFAGCGIVGDSNPESEYQETIIKFKPMLSALGGME